MAVTNKQMTGHGVRCQAPRTEKADRQDGAAVHCGLRTRSWFSPQHQHQPETWHLMMPPWGSLVHHLS